MLRSFRLKIGLLSVCLSVLLLFGFGMYAQIQLKKTGTERIDFELRALVDAHVRMRHPDMHWSLFYDSLKTIYGDEADKQFILKVNDWSGDALYISSSWPENLSSEDLPIPEESEDLFWGAPPPDWPDEGGHDPFEGHPRRHPPEHRLFQIQEPVYATLNISGGNWRIMTTANPEITLYIGMNLSRQIAEIRHFQQALLFGGMLALLLVVAGGWIIGNFALRPVNLIARTAETVTAHRLDARIPETGMDEEFGKLIVLINGMLARLEKSFQQATRFSADAAHELKTPLAIMQIQVEEWLQRAGDGSVEQREYAEQLDEVQRLKVILRKLLLLSQADSGQMKLVSAKTNLADMARAVAEDISILAPDRHTAANLPEELFVMADAPLLNQVLENLISNAVKFGDADGSIDITLETHDGMAELAVSNTGTPIPHEDQNKVFDRFYRVDKARNRAIDGTGLGLSLALEIAKAHGGYLILKQSNERGTCFMLILPLTPS